MTHISPRTTRSDHRSHRRSGSVSPPSGTVPAGPSTDRTIDGPGAPFTGMDPAAARGPAAVGLPLVGSIDRAEVARSGNGARPIRQLSSRGMAAVWLAATGPMAVASWIVAPRLASSLGQFGMAKALIATLTAGLVWQFVLVMILVAREQGSLRWAALRLALGLRSPVSPVTARRGGRLWLLLIPLSVGFAATSLVLPSLPIPGDRDLGEILASTAGRSWLHGAWGWYALEAVLVLFNTVLGEELLFRGYLLPRMRGAFGRWAWLANGVMFAAYHLHMPWVIPGTLLDSFVLAYPSQRYRSSWIGIAVHSSQSVFFLVLIGAIVLGLG